MRLPGIEYADRIIGQSSSVQIQLPDGRWVPCRPEPFHSITQRWKAAWLVFTGRADALVWPGQ